MKNPIKNLTIPEYNQIKTRSLFLGPEPPVNRLGRNGDLFILYKETVNADMLVPYNLALSKVGLNPVDSLDVILSNSEMCAALAGNDEASLIMEINYATEIAEALEASWSEGLNKLSHACNLSCTLIKLRHQTDPGGLETALTPWNHPWTNRSEIGWSTTCSNLKYTADATYCNTLRSLVPIDVTEYCTISFNLSMENTNYYSDQLSVYPCLISAASGTPVVSTTWDKAWGTHVRETRYTVELDVSDVVGEYYVCLRLVGNSSDDNVFTIWINECKLISVGEPWEEALKLVGLSANSLEEVLSNSSTCATLAANADAINLMKTNYSTEITNAITNNWNDGLNTLSHKCQLTCYLYKNGYTTIMPSMFRGGSETVSSQKCGRTTSNGTQGDWSPIINFTGYATIKFQVMRTSGNEDSNFNITKIRGDLPTRGTYEFYNMNTTGVKTVTIPTAARVADTFFIWTRTHNGDAAISYIQLIPV